MMPTRTPSTPCLGSRAFLEHDFQWYFNLGVAASEHQALDPSFIEVPVTIAAGGFDVMTSMRDIVAFAEKILHAVVHVLHGTHMLPIEFPDLVLDMVLTCMRSAGVGARGGGASSVSQSGLIQRHPGRGAVVS